jgi:hypothetical protein
MPRRSGGIAIAVKISAKRGILVKEMICGQGGLKPEVDSVQKSRTFDPIGRMKSREQKTLPAVPAMIEN